MVKQCCQIDNDRMIIYGANVLTITAHASYQFSFSHNIKEGQIIQCDNDELALNRAIKKLDTKMLP